MRYDDPYEAELAAEPAFFEAQIIDSPATVDDVVRVTIASRDDGVVGPCRWAPNAGADGPELPSAGDWALVVFSNQQTPCILLWRPA